MQLTPISARRRRNPASSLLSALRGDKHMVGAYPPTRDGALDQRGRQPRLRRDEMKPMHREFDRDSGDARRAAADVRLNAGSANGAEEN